MPKNQKNIRIKKYRRDQNHAEFLDNIDFFSIIRQKSIILVYDPRALVLDIRLYDFGVNRDSSACGLRMT